MLLKDWIKTLGLSQLEISEVIEQSQAQVSNKLKNDKLHFSDFIKICRHLKIDPATVINDFEYSPGKLNESQRVKEKRLKRTKTYESFRQQRLQKSLGGKKLLMFKKVLSPEDYEFYRTKYAHYRIWYTKEKKKEDLVILFDYFVKNTTG